MAILTVGETSIEHSFQSVNIVLPNLPAINYFAAIHERPSLNENLQKGQLLTSNLLLLFYSSLKHIKALLSRETHLAAVYYIINFTA